MAPQAIPKYLSALHKNSTLGTGTEFSLSTAAHEQLSRRSPHSPALHEGQFSQSIHGESGHIQPVRVHNSIAHVKQYSNQIGHRLPSMQDHLGPPALRVGPSLQPFGAHQSAAYSKGATSELRMRHAYRLSPKVRKSPFPTTDKRSTFKKIAKSKMYMKDQYQEEGFLQEDSIMSHRQY